MAKINEPDFSFRKIVASPKFVYNVKFICGIQKNPFENDCTAILSKGIYSTEINILNFGFRKIVIAKAFYPLVVKNQSIAIEPKFSRFVNVERVELPPLSATMDDCCKLAEMIKVKDEHLKIGFLEIVSPVELEVVAVYTVTNLEQDDPNINVVQIQGKKLTLG
jgi:hypothetical protein